MSAAQPAVAALNGQVVGQLDGTIQMNARNDAAVFGDRVDGQSYVIRPSAYALIEDDDGRFAVVAAPMGWFLPGGGIEADETPEQAIAREALEECGLIVEPGLRIAEAIQLVYSAREDTYFEKPSVFMRATVLGTRTSRSEDNHQLLWITGEAGADRMAHASHAWVLRGAAHTGVAGGRPPRSLRSLGCSPLNARSLGVHAQMKTIRIRGDFNGLFGDLLCLSHSNVANDEAGAEVRLSEGLQVIAFEDDVEDGQPCFLVAAGHVVPAPEDLVHGGSVWCLQIDERGVRYVSTLDDA